MRDPLEALREPVRPVRPDPAFAAELRARLERAVLNPRGATMTATEPTQVTIPTVGPTEGDVVYASLWSRDVDLAAEFYRSVLGGPPPIGMSAAEHNTLFLCHAVNDVPAAVARIRAAGGRADEPEDRPDGLIADCTDNQGMRFAVIQAPTEGRAPIVPEGVGALLYLTVHVPDSARYREFYGAVFGWTFTPGRVGDGWGIDQPRPMSGMRGMAGPPTVVPMYAVPDVAAAVARVRAAGGTADDPQQMPYGLTADCVDNQGMPFYLGQL